MHVTHPLAPMTHAVTDLGTGLTARRDPDRPHGMIVHVHCDTYWIRWDPEHGRWEIDRPAAQGGFSALTDALCWIAGRAL